jgi:hypothetical protein
MRRTFVTVLVGLLGPFGVFAGDNFPQPYYEADDQLRDNERGLLRIKKEMERDEIWQLIPHVISSGDCGSHVPELTQALCAKYQGLLKEVEFVQYVDKVDDLIQFK